MDKPLFENVDCVSLTVSDIDEGIAFYSGKLGLRLLWRAEASCGLGTQTGETEVVLVTKNNPTVDFKVDDVCSAIDVYTGAGGKLEYGPFDIDIGKCAVVSDEWGNRYCLLDMTKGKYITDENGGVIGVGAEATDESENKKNN